MIPQSAVNKSLEPPEEDLQNLETPKSLESKRDDIECSRMVVVAIVVAHVLDGENWMGKIGEGVLGAI